MRGVWGIGKWRFGNDWGKRIWLFDKLVWTVMSYGVEIWGWREREEMERLEERFLRWILGIEWNTLGYMVREELQRFRLGGRGGRRAWGYEKRLEEGRGSELARMCLAEMKERFGSRRALTGWEEERREFFEGRGMRIEEVERRREGDEDWFWEMERRERKRQTVERWGKIN